MAVKPAAGVMDLATKTTEGIKNTTNLFKTQRRVRPPRAFAKGKVLIVFLSSLSFSFFSSFFCVHLFMMH